MTVSYTDTLLTDRDKVRFHLGDTVSGSGPKPADANFTDGEIDGLVTTEGSWDKAVAAGFEALASLWANHVTFEADGTSVQQSDKAKRYEALAKRWRDKSGGGYASGSRTVTRADAYSSDYTNTES